MRRINSAATNFIVVCPKIPDIFVNPIDLLVIFAILRITIARKEGRVAGKSYRSFETLRYIPTF